MLTVVISAKSEIDDVQCIRYTTRNLIPAVPSMCMCTM